MNEDHKINTSSYPLRNNETNSENFQSHDFKAEQSVLGSLMFENADTPLWDKIASLLNDKDFWDSRHQIIFRSIERLHKVEGVYADIVTLSADLSEHKQLEQIGGQNYLAELSNVVPSPYSIDAYAKIVHNFSMKRKLMLLCSSTISQIQQGTDYDIADLFQQTEQKLQNLAQESVTDDNGPRALGELLVPAVERIKKNMENKSGITGISTGYTLLDGKTAGLHGGELIIVAARPSMGKTTFALNLIQHIFMNPEVDRPTVVFSLEMPSWQLMIKLISSIARVEMEKLNKGEIGSEEFKRIAIAASHLNDRKEFLFVDDRGGLTPMQVSAEIRKIAKEHNGISAIMIDYLQLMKFPGFENDKQHEISEISAALKRIAKEFDVPVIALSQLNRGLEQRTDKRPMNSDLRESGAIEQDADIIMFIYRDEVYHPDSKDKGMAEIIIGKQRNGPIGKIKLVFEGKYSTFSNWNETYSELE